MSERSWPSLTAVIHAVVLRAPSGLEPHTIASLLPDKPYQTLMSELSRQRGHKLGADLVLPLIKLTGAAEPLNFLARQMGGVFILLPPAADSNAELVVALAQSVQEFGDFAAETARDISDGRIPADQLARIDQEGDEAIQAIITMKKLARATHEAQYGGNAHGR